MKPSTPNKIYTYIDLTDGEANGMVIDIPDQPQRAMPSSTVGRRRIGNVKSPYAPNTSPEPTNSEEANSAQRPLPSPSTTPTRSPISLSSDSETESELSDGPDSMDLTVDEAALAQGAFTNDPQNSEEKHRQSQQEVKSAEDIVKDLDKNDHCCKTEAESKDEIEISDKGGKKHEEQSLPVQRQGGEKHEEQSLPVQRQGGEKMNSIAEADMDETEDDFEFSSRGKGTSKGKESTQPKQTLQKRRRSYGKNQRNDLVVFPNLRRGPQCRPTTHKLPTITRTSPTPMPSPRFSSTTWMASSDTEGLNLLYTACIESEANQIPCTSPSCPIPTPHGEGMYRFPGNPIPNSAEANKYYFPSIPPPDIVAAYNAIFHPPHMPTYAHLLLKDAFFYHHTLPSRPPPAAHLALISSSPCTNTHCPVQHPHHAGAYFHLNRRPSLSMQRATKGVFGVSNPPPAIWTMVLRMKEGGFDDEAVLDFAASHARYENGAEGMLSADWQKSRLEMRA